MTARTTTAIAHANIALVKYWGKRNAKLNIPAAPSLSLTLDALTTTTTVTFMANLTADSLMLNGAPANAGATARVSSFLELVRTRAGIATRAQITSANNFPTASGLASSASAYAALALAATAAAGLTLSNRALSSLARQGSGSAARSIFGGFAYMHCDGDSAWAEPITSDWPLAMVIAIVDGGKVKTVSSRDAMTHCAQTSPLYRAWLASVPPDMTAARNAIDARNLTTLGAITESSALAMHAAALASRPTIRYWQPATLAVMTAVEAARADGIEAYYTMDAGPHGKVLTTAEHANALACRLRTVDGVTDTIVSGPGGPARLT